MSSTFVVQDGFASKQDRCVTRLLEFFGVGSRVGTTTDVMSGNCTGPGFDKSRVLCSAKAFLQLIENLEKLSDCKDQWVNRVHSAFVYPGDDASALQQLARLLGAVEMTPLSRSNDEDFSISNECDDFCGVMAGVKVNRPAVNSDGYLVSKANRNATQIISSRKGASFLKGEYHGVAVFLSTFSDVIDIDAELASQNFDIREHLFRAAPIVLYIKWAFHTCWNAPEANACLIIDDPLLRRRYGCVDFKRLLAAMEAHHFSTSIAFIPWNWRRSSAEIIRLFKENAENFSLSVHGCDHVRGEFGVSDRSRLYGKARRALERMSNHASDTGLQHDCVMVFPQGVFSKAGMSALKHTNFIAAVNNDVVSTDLEPVTIADVWKTAVMRYSGFPIFTRRYPWEGIENFAFDLLLGKPALIVIHHDYCSDGCDRLNGFIEELNRLKCPLRWRNLADVIRHSYRQRPLSSGSAEVEMYAKELLLENHTDQRVQYLVRRHESNPSDIKEIHSGSKNIPYECHEGFINFGVDLDAGESRLIRVVMHELTEVVPTKEKLSYRLRTMLRRYLCELRDNHITPARLRLVGSR